MLANRSVVVNAKKVEEFYWAGRWVCYVDNVLMEGKYEDIANLLAKDDESMRDCEECDGEGSVYVTSKHYVDERTKWKRCVAEETIIETCDGCGGIGRKKFA
jgi:hypothetical protein